MRWDGSDCCHGILIVVVIIYAQATMPFTHHHYSIISIITDESDIKKGPSISCKAAAAVIVGILLHINNYYNLSTHGSYTLEYNSHIPRPQCSRGQTVVYLV